MVRSCCVKNCHSTLTKLKKMRGVSFHLFPKSNPEILSKWLQFLNYGSDWVPLKSSSICSLHFNDCDFRLGTNLRMLKTSAVPSIFVTSVNTVPQITKIEPQEIVIADEILSHEVFGTCRLCNLEFKCGLNNLFDVDNNFPYQIFKCLHITVSPNEGLPPYICYSCRQKLNYFENFIDDVIKAQDILNNKNNMVSNSTQDTVSLNCNDIIEEYYPPSGLNTALSKICNSEVEEKCRKLLSTSKQSLSIIPVEFSKTDMRNDVPRDNLLNPIKLEITSNREILGKNLYGAPNTDRLNKKIEILEDIKIEPPLNQIAYKSFKTIYDESLSTINRTTAHRILQPDIPKKYNILQKKKVGKKVKRNKLLSKSTVVCNDCKAKFISKYALNHHVKHLCPKNENNLTKPVKPIKLKKVSNLETTVIHNSKVLPENNNVSFENPPLQTKHRRKPVLTVKSEYY